MKSLLLSIFFFACLHIGFSQVNTDSLRLRAKRINNAIHQKDSANNRLTAVLDGLQLPGDSTMRASYHKVDSIRSNFQSKADSLQRVYQKPINQLNETRGSLQKKIDSLQALRLPTIGLTKKLDSVGNLSAQKMGEMKSEVEKLKNKATNGLNSLVLPPEVKEHTDKLRQSLGTYQIPTANGTIPNIGGSSGLPGFNLPGGVNAPTLGGANLPNTSAPALPGLGSISDITKGTKEITDLTKEASGYAKDIQQLSKGDIADVKNLEKKATDELKNVEGLKEIDGKKGELEKYKSQLANPDSIALSMAKEQAKEMVMKEATNHFAGKEDIVKGAMDKMTSLKSKYSEVKSLADLPKRLPNPLKGKPLRERLVPALTLQIMTQKNVLLDLNPSIAYRISPRFKSGIGWVERITFDDWKPTIPERVFGLRNYTEYQLPKGFQARADIERLNAILPPLIINAGDLGTRDWEWSALIGLKKEFKISKTVTGNVQTMYRLWSDKNKVPFPDRLNIRIGFEFPMKKKVKK
ncbi:MAG: hypothetical protein IM631_09630 [Cytophagales bacterium]|nr:hypothetical protein [Cytophagales bacterium]MCA6367293.1 hypothetical protein [Cytophagales bacterium]MCA6371650.1 hypothetical protein [Cytophagales bacterium]MCA6377051.1 hypothetical protein [Cytophagales bacterium]MCA6383875.1 hypothetical protein [Cytophagales bacterium]